MHRFTTVNLISFACLFVQTANAEGNSTLTTSRNNQINGMLALGVIDFSLTAATTAAFYFGNGKKLCGFGKSQLIPLLNSAALIATASAAKVTQHRSWFVAASVHATLLGSINLFRAYFGVWYHWIGGNPLPFMSEHHDNFQILDDATFRPFSWTQLISPSFHRSTAKDIFENFIFEEDSRLATATRGTILIGLPVLIAAGGIAQLALGIVGLIN